MDLSPEARRVLALASAARTPSSRDKARVEARLALALGVSATVASSVAVGHAAASVSSVSAKSAASYVLLKWGIGAAALLAVATGGYLSSAPRTPAAERAPNSAAPANAEAAPAPVLAPSNRVASVPATLPSAEQAEPRHPASSAHARAGGAAEPTGAAELSLLHGAQAAWRRGDAARALALLKEHGRRFPRSLLGLERDALRVLNLCELGDKRQARRLAQQILARAPHSPMRTSIEQSCALK